MAKDNNLTDLLIDVANAIREKKGSSDLINPQDFSEEILNLSGDVLTEKDCNFYDCDGTLLYAFSKEEALALTELPIPPSHPDKEIEFTSYTATLDEIKDAGGILDIGCFYTTIDGCNAFLIEVNETNINTVCSLKCSVADFHNIDWGDGTIVNINDIETDNNGYLVWKHTYSSYGDYKIKLLPPYTNIYNRVDINSFSHIQFIKEIYCSSVTLRISFEKVFNLNTIWYSKGYTISSIDSLSTRLEYTYNLKYIYYDWSNSGSYDYCYYSCRCIIIGKNIYRASPTTFYSKSKRLCLNKYVTKFYYNNSYSYMLGDIEKVVCSKDFNSTLQIYGILNGALVKEVYLNQTLAQSGGLNLPSVQLMKYDNSVTSIANFNGSAGWICPVCTLDLSEIDHFVTLSGSGILNPSNYLGKIKVKKEFLEDYKNSTNWSAYANNFVGV